MIEKKRSVVSCTVLCITKYRYLDIAYPLFRPCNHLANLSATDSISRKGNHLLKSARERASDRDRVTYVRNFQQKPTGFTVGAVHRPSYLDLEIGTITRECARRKQKKKQRKAESGEREARARGTWRDEDALLLAPAGDVRRDFLFGPAQPRGSLLLF